MARAAPGEARRDAVAGGIGLALAGAYWLGAEAIRSSPLAGNGVGASAVPKGLAVALACFSAGLVLQSIRAWRVAARSKPAAAAPSGSSRRHLRAAGMLLIGIAFLAVLETLGYWLSLVLLLAVTAAYNGHPASKRLARFVLIVSIIYYLLFVQLLGIPLPSGVWPSLWPDFGSFFT